MVKELAGLEGIEPPLAVLETAVLPLNDRPMNLPIIKLVTQENNLSNLVQ